MALRAAPPLRFGPGSLLGRRRGSELPPKGPWDSRRSLAERAAEQQPAPGSAGRGSLGRERGRAGAGGGDGRRERWGENHPRERESSLPPSTGLAPRREGTGERPARADPARNGSV